MREMCAKAEHMPCNMPLGHHPGFTRSAESQVEALVMDFARLQVQNQPGVISHQFGGAEPAALERRIHGIFQVP